MLCDNVLIDHFIIIINLVLKYKENVTRDVTDINVTDYRSFFAQNVTSHRYSYLLGKYD